MTETNDDIETKQARFQRIAADRVEKAVERIRMIGRMADMGDRYDWSEAEVDKMEGALIRALEEALGGFRATGEPEPAPFSF